MPQKTHTESCRAAASLFFCTAKCASNSTGGTYSRRDAATLGGGRHHPQGRKQVLGTLWWVLDLAAGQGAYGDRPPHVLVPLIWQNKKVLFALLFEASAATLLEVASDAKHLGAQIGFLSILHTWGQTLQPHPHVHCVVPGGGLSPDRARWVASRGL